MELRKNYRKLTTALSRFWHREAGPMNWKNPVRVTAYIGWEIFNGVAFLVGEWVRYGVRASQIFLAIPPTVILFCGGVWFAVWSFVRRPFPALETVPLLDLLEYHNPTFYSAVVLWYYLSPLVAVMLTGSIVLSVWKVWIEARKRDLIPFGALPLGRFRRSSPARKSSSGKCIIRSNPRRFSTPNGSPSRSADCTPALPFSERWGAAKLRPVCTPSPSSYSPGKRTIQRSGRRLLCSK